MVSDHVRGSFGMKYFKERRIEVVRWCHFVRRFEQGHNYTRSCLSLNSCSNAGTRYKRKRASGRRCDSIGLEIKYAGMLRYLAPNLYT